MKDIIDKPDMDKFRPDRWFITEIINSISQLGYLTVKERVKLQKYTDEVVSQSEEIDNKKK